MFGIRSLQGKTVSDPLQSRRTVVVWIGQLPPLDVMSRVQAATEALGAMVQAGVEVDRDRVAAIGYLDAALEGDLHRLIAWFLDNQESSPGLAERFWQAAHALNKAFVQAYEAAVVPACAAAGDNAWEPVRPLLIAQLIHCHGVDAKLRLFRRQHWIPAKWAQLHALFRRATELGIERIAAAPDSRDPLAPELTIEQRYVSVLLIHRLDTGNLAPVEIEWASTRLLAWSREISLDAAAWTAEGFYVDLQGTTGLVRRTGNDQGDMVGYLDPTPIAKHLDEALSDAMAMPSELEEDELAARQRHIATLEKLRPAISPKRATDYRRHPRFPMNLSATVRVGLARICVAIADADQSKVAAAAGAEAAGQVPYASLKLDPHAATLEALARPRPKGAKVMPARERPPPRPPTTPAGFPDLNAPNIFPEHVDLVPLGPYGRPEIAPPTPVPAAEPAPPPAARVAAVAEPNWRIKDMSSAGWRMGAPEAAGHQLALGALITARREGSKDWMLGVVRRVNDTSRGEIDAGVALLAERAVVVTLYAQRTAQEDMSFVVDGVDTATIGASFQGLYLLPPANSDLTVSMRTLIVPVAEYAEGRRLILVTGRSDYMVALRHLVDRRSEWGWVTMQIVSRMERS